MSRGHGLALAATLALARAAYAAHGGVPTVALTEPRQATPVKLPGLLRPAVRCTNTDQR